MARKDHVEMVKFDSAEDDGFQAILHYLNDPIKAIREYQSKIETGAQAERDEAEKTLRERR